MATRHSHKPNFGKKVDGCPRCDELKAGATPVSWNIRNDVRLDEQRRDSINAHFAPGSSHARGECGPVCTFGDW
ncbi:hypothetical protein [Streptomyces sp. NPDC005780]|uniref:hypothetical protein n=1 Tax=Streptomyces sp. NPDC005780 TaxID=3364730 RepID=UPI0036742E4F